MGNFLLLVLDQVTELARKPINALEDSSSDTKKNKKFQELFTAMSKNNLVTPVVYTNINGKNTVVGQKT